jgi:hypothetical protein
MLPSPLLFSRQFPLLAQSYLEEYQQHNCAKTEGDQGDGEHFAGQPTHQRGAGRTSDDERRGRSKCQDAQAGRHRPKVSLRLTPEQITVARNESAASRETELFPGSHRRACCGRRGGASEHTIGSQAALGFVEKQHRGERSNDVAGS